MIQLSSTATQEILRLRSQQPSPSLKLHLAVHPTGCLGLSYSLDFAEQVQPGEVIYPCGAIQVAIPENDLKYVDGLLLDYSEDLMGGGFRFHNPNATQTCSCGNSFAL